MGCAPAKHSTVVESGVNENDSVVFNNNNGNIQNKKKISDNSIQTIELKNCDENETDKNETDKNEHGTVTNKEAIEDKTNNLECEIPVNMNGRLIARDDDCRLRSVSIRTDDGFTIDVEESSAQTSGDVLKLHNAMKGLGTNEEELIQIIVSSRAAYRQVLRSKYEEEYDEDLIKNVKRNTSGMLQHLLLNLLLERDEFLTRLMRDYIEDQKYVLMSELLTAWNASNIYEAKLRYEKLFESSFENDVIKSLNDLVPRSLKDVVIPLCTLQRDESSREVDHSIIHQEADKLCEGPDEISSLLLQTSCNIATLSAIFKCYKFKYYMDITDNIDIEFHDDAKRFLTTIVQVCEDTPKYFATQLQAAVVENDKKRFINILVGRHELDLLQVSRAYAELHEGRTLTEVVKKNFSGGSEKAICLMLQKYV